MTRAAVAAVILALTLSGCASEPPALDQSAAGRLQTGVLSVTTAVSAGDYADAQAALDALQADLLAAASAGDVSGERSARIQSAIDRVGADLDAAIEAARPTPTPTPTEDSQPGKDGDKDDGKGKGKGKDG